MKINDFSANTAPKDMNSIGHLCILSVHLWYDFHFGAHQGTNIYFCISLRQYQLNNLVDEIFGAKNVHTVGPNKKKSFELFLDTGGQIKKKYLKWVHPGGKKRK